MLKVEDEEIDQFLYGDACRLERNLEYHLLGNHLLENAFAILFAAYYFKCRKWHRLAKKILYEQLAEQILSDGGHFELSPMYHQNVLQRCLDGINLISTNQSFEDKLLLEFMRVQSTKMLRWLSTVTFSDGAIPFVNDSTVDIAPSTSQLVEYAETLGLETSQNVTLTSSGYRKWKTAQFEAFMDIGEIGADYIPGHAHSDTFNFLLHIQGQPFIVDTGITTYDKNTRRNDERSTRAHNTVMVEEREQTEIWSGFRVANRARIIERVEEGNCISASHNGYISKDIIHTRSFSLKGQVFQIKDTLNKASSAHAFLHFCPSIDLHVVGNEVRTKKAHIQIYGAEKIRLENYSVSRGFNKSEPAKRLVIYFRKELNTSISMDADTVSIR